MTLTLVDALRACAHHTEKGMTFVRSNGTERHCSYAELWAEVRKRALRLSRYGIERGDRVALTLPEPDDFVLNFFAVSAAGGVPVPLYPPHTLARLDAYVGNLERILTASGARVHICGVRALPLSERLGHVKRIGAEEMAEPGETPAEAPVVVGPGDLGLLQFTSGSTSEPKGVMVTHGNLAANSRAIMFDGLNADPAVDKGVSWLPLYHDMGLIGFVIAPIFAEVPVVLLPTTTFIRRPSSWFEAITRHRGTISFAPNFAFALATQALSPQKMAGYDLSSLRALGCGAEPIDPTIVRAFLDKFASVGLRRTAILPSYGLAESTLAVTFRKLGEPLLTDRCDPDALRRGVATAAPNGTAREIVSCGRPFPEHRVTVIDGEGRPLPERRIGEVVISGPSVARGYFGAPEATAETFAEGGLRSGDLGYFADGELYICGRTKDLIIVRGRNYFPQDIERIISGVPGVRDSQVAVFASEPGGPRNQLIAVAEARQPAGGEAAQLAHIVKGAVFEQMGVQLDEVVLVRRGSLPKTSSGKIRRRETRARWQAGTLGSTEAAGKGADSEG